MKCPIRDMYPCKESECAIWDIRRKCCGFITQPPINEDILLEYIDKRFYEAMMQKSDSCEQK